MESEIAPLIYTRQMCIEKGAHVETLIFLGVDVDTTRIDGI